ncbi:ethylene-responsive transcription factor ERF017-like [Euphorbia lathyris]|uniref:ethylene-responsive transcription factor ERF017-like n=1 Tax=Euphorbia lathyris TaxID=212925 RepID=UPI0033144D3B
MVKTGTSSQSPSPPSPATDRNENHNQPKYTGVRKRKWGKWVCEIRLPNSRERIWLGSYDSPEKAARAFDAALYCLRGPNARFNFPDNPPDIVGGQSLPPHEIQAVAARYANDNPTPTAVETNTTTTTTTGEQNDSSSTSANVESALDWSFLNMLDCNNNQEFGYYTVMDNIGDGYYPPAPPPSSLFDDDDDDSSYSHQSFLWNF